MPLFMFQIFILVIYATVALITITHLNKKQLKRGTAKIDSQIFDTAKVKFSIRNFRKPWETEGNSL